MNNFNLTPAQLLKKVGVTQQRVSQLIQSHRLKEGIHYIKLTNRFFMYSEEAVKIIKEKRKWKHPKN